MKRIILFLISLSSLFSCIHTSAQSRKQLNGSFTISAFDVPTMTATGTFIDGGNTYSATDVRPGDRIIDADGKTFEILSVSGSFNPIKIILKSFNAGEIPSFGTGSLFRPSENGFPLVTNNSPTSLLISTINTTTLSIDKSITRHHFGSVLPANNYNQGEVVILTGDTKPYKLTSLGWEPVSETEISTEYVPLSSLPQRPKGSLVSLFFENFKIYVSDGTSWVSPPNISILPVIPKYGDVYYLIGEGKLYMYDANNKWVNIGGGSVPGNTLPPSGDAKPGDTFYHTSENKLYVYNGTDWIPMDNALAEGQFYIGDNKGIAAGRDKNTIPISGFDKAAADVAFGDGTNNFKITNLANPAADQDAATKKYVDTKAAETPSGGTLPATGTVKAGDTFYNTTDKHFYVFDGTNWIPVVNNALPQGQFYVGDADGKAAATAKNTIPVSGFDKAAADVAMGDGTNNFKITNLADPVLEQDAATKKYVDLKTRGVPNGDALPVSGKEKAGDTFYHTTEKRFYVYDGSSWMPVAQNLLPTGQFYVGDADGKATAVAKNTIPLSGFDKAVADIAMGDGTNNFKITNLADPANSRDAVTKNYVDTKTIDPNNISLTSGDLLVGNGSGKAASTAKNTVPLSGFARATEDIAIGDGTNNFKIINLADPAADQDAATKKYVDGKFADPSSIALNDGKILIGNGTNQATAQSVTGDVSINNAGVATIANEAVDASRIKAGSVTLDKLATAGTADANKVYSTDADGKPVLVDKNTLGGAGSGETFASDFVVKGVPNFLKWTDGQTVPAAGKTAVQLMLEGSQMAVAPAYASPTVTITGSPAPGNFEFGQNLGTINLNSTFNQKDGGAETARTYFKNGVALPSASDVISNLTSPVTYSVKVDYAEGPVKNNNLGDADPSGRIAAGSVTASVTYTPLASRYYGFVTSMNPSDAEVQALTKDQSTSRTLKTTLTNPSTPKYICFRYPVGQGALTAIKVNGFSSTGAFTITQGMFTNAQGHSSNYYLVIGNNPVDDSGASSSDLDFQ